MSSKLHKLIGTLALRVPVVTLGKCLRQQETYSLPETTWTVQKIHDSDTVTVVDQSVHIGKFDLQILMLQNIGSLLGKQLTSHSLRS